METGVGRVEELECVKIKRGMRNKEKHKKDEMREKVEKGW